MPSGAAPLRPEGLKTLPCLVGDDELAAGIRADLAVSGSVLELMKSYVEALRALRTTTPHLAGFTDGSTIWASERSSPPHLY